MAEKFELIDSNEEQNTLIVRTRTSISNLPQEIGKNYGLIGEYLNEIKEKPTDYPFVAYYNMDMENLDVEIGFPVAKKLEGKDNIKPGIIPKGKRITGTHKGSYKNLTVTYKEMGDFALEKGYKNTDIKAAYEFYLNSPVEVDENDLVTKIMFLL